MKIATLDLSVDLFLDFCKACKSGPPRRFHVIRNPLPDDAQIVSAAPLTNVYPMTFRLFIESDSFQDIPEGSIPPELPNIHFQTDYDEVSAMVA